MCGSCGWTRQLPARRTARTTWTCAAAAPSASRFEALLAGKPHYGSAPIMEQSAPCLYGSDKLWYLSTQHLNSQSREREISARAQQGLVYHAELSRENDCRSRRWTGSATAAPTARPERCPRHWCRPTPSESSSTTQTPGSAPGALRLGKQPIYSKLIFAGF